MASIYKRGKRWRAEIRLRGVYESITRPTKLEVELWAKQREAEILRNDGDSFAPVVKTLADALKRYADEVSVKKKGARWEQIRIDKFLSDLPFVGKLINKITSDDVAKWRDVRLASRKHDGDLISADTVRRELTILSSVFEVARLEWKWCRINPIKDIKKPPEGKPRDRRISLDEISAMLQALNYVEGVSPTTLKQEIAYLFLLALETAMRRGEILSLSYDDLYLTQRYVRLKDTKNGDIRNVPLSRRAVELFKLLVANKNDTGLVFRVSNGSADTLFRKARDITGIKELRFHDTRHEAITQLARKLPVLDLARMIGHRDPRSLMIYYNETAEEIAAKLD